MAESSPNGASSGPTLLQRTTHGVLWGVTLAILSRVVGVVLQLALVWLLAKSDFGLMGLAYTVTAFVNLFANPGIDAVLVQRQRRFHLWSSPAFWMGMTTGSLGMLITMAAAPLAAWIYAKPGLVGLLLVMALAIPLHAAQIVPKAQLQAQLRFKTGLQIAFTGHLITAALTILFAYLGFGAYSFAIPLPITAAFLAVVSWRAARPRVKRQPHFNRWKYLLGDSVSLAGMRIMLNIVGQGDYMVLGLARFPEAAIGVYVFAFNIAIQPFRMIVGSIETVLFPSLSRVALDPEKQTRAMFRAARLLAMVIVPVCTLQILLAGPLFRLIIPARWLDAVVPLQIISLAVMISTPYCPGWSLMMAQRRFPDLLRVSLVNGVTFFATVSCFVWMHRSIQSAAIGVTLWNVISSPYVFWVAAGRRQAFLIYYIETYRPYLASMVAAIPCMVIILLLPATSMADAAALVVITALFSTAYLLLLRLIDSSGFDDLLLQLTPLLEKAGLRRLPVRSDSAAKESLP